MTPLVSESPLAVRRRLSHRNARQRPPRQTGGTSPGAGARWRLVPQIDRRRGRKELQRETVFNRAPTAEALRPCHHAFRRSQCRLGAARTGLPPEAMKGCKELVWPAGACRCARRIFMSPTFFCVLVVRITAEQMRPMLKRESFAIAKIYVPVKRRATLRPEAVREIAESMLEIGQETLILVRRDGDRFVLVEGLHRLEACKALGE